MTRFRGCVNTHCTRKETHKTYTSQRRENIPKSLKLLAIREFKESSKKGDEARSEGVYTQVPCFRSLYVLPRDSGSQTPVVIAARIPLHFSSACTYTHTNRYVGVGVVGRGDRGTHVGQEHVERGDPLRGIAKDGQIRQTASAVDAEVGEEGGEGRVWSGAGSHAVGLGEGVLREGGEAQHERGELKHVGNECGLRCDVAQMCGRTEVCDACVGACVYSAGRHHG
eukprot:scaffold111590_cov75-Phaeocystis_antarctica.AAC.3